jgi:STE24 endopeptidase
LKSLLLLVVFGIWMAGVESQRPSNPPDSAGPHTAAHATAAGQILTTEHVRDLALFLGGYAIIVLSMAVWSRILARQVNTDSLHKSLSRYNLGIFASRLAIPAWMAAGVFALGWVPIALAPLHALDRYPIITPTTLFGVLPALAAWVGLWWAQFPADHAVREQSMLLAYDKELPIHHPPALWPYLSARIRIDLLFMLVPIVMILLLHDGVSLALWSLHWIDSTGSAIGPLSDSLIAAIDLVPALAVFIIAPEVLRRVLQTRVVPPSPLTDRLEAMCHRAGLRYRAILLWLTQDNVGNAAVMGILPRLRYILLTDLLMESMTDEQIEAVFAHELGHVVHKHLLWYGALVLLLLLAAAGPLQSLDDLIQSHVPLWARDTLPVAITLVFFILMFGKVSRSFERQADVYAARTMDALSGRRRSSVADLPAADTSDDSASIGDLALATQTVTRPTIASEPAAWPTISPVLGPTGYAAFASALNRVALINNIPTDARDFYHGSIAARISYLHWLSLDPNRTILFERSARMVYYALVAAIIICGAWAAVLAYCGG